MYVVSHKKVDLPLPTDYEYIQVNAAKNENIYSLKDNIGCNISEKNDTYCELTALYWIWKNDKENDVVGLSHYRRYFTTWRFSSSPNSFLSSKKVAKYLKDNDFVCSNLYNCGTTVYEHILQDVHEHDIKLLENSIKRVCPDYLPDFNIVMEGQETYLLNMLVTTKKQFDNYCEWLFALLFDLEQYVDMTGYSTQQRRLYGYLAERLQTVYLYHNHMRVKCSSVMLWGIPKIDIVLDKIKRSAKINKK